MENYQDKPLLTMSFSNGTWHYHIEVVEHTKSDAGYRIIYVAPS